MNISSVIQIHFFLQRGFFQTKLYGHDSHFGTPFVAHGAKLFDVPEPGNGGNIFHEKRFKHTTVTVILKRQFRVKK